MAGRPSESSARDHLANERTFLAYVRTSLAFVAFGFGIARFAIAFRELALARSGTTSGPSVVFGVVMVSVGILVAFFGAWRYIRERSALLTGSTKSLSPGIVIVVAAILVVFGLFTAYDLLRYWGGG
jgi:putative membrane protein